MAQIIVSANYFGKAILATHRKDNVSITQLKRLFGCSTKQLHDYIHGIDLIPQETLCRILKYAIMTDAMVDPEK